MVVQGMAEPAPVVTGVPMAQTAAPVPMIITEAPPGPKPADYLETSELTGCWCNTCMSGAHCVGLTEHGPNTLIASPPDCVCLVPLCPAWACHCAPVVYHREGQTNKFQSYGEGMWLQARGARSRRARPTLTRAGLRRRRSSARAPT